MNETNDIDLELCDLGDAKEATKQVTPLPMVPDWIFGWGEPQ
jgi:hypothetical protein